jgi:DNA-binding transcriptional MerR regulator
MPEQRLPPLSGDRAAPDETVRLPDIVGDREYFNIGEACRILQIPQHTLRYWETRFSTLRPTRLPGGHRRYARRDLETALRIKDLLHTQKMTIDGARKALAGSRRGGRAPLDARGRPLPAAALKMLREIRDDLNRLASELSQ